jgi:2-hydroxy-3-keto-5-methylthiopentenyl-1-phosphate phosphatase
MIRIFTDFDGTVTRGDVGDALFERFGGDTSVKAVEEYREGSLSAVGCFQAECAACGEVDERQFDAFLESRTIDDTFPEFVRWCRDRGYPLMILSDGMDAYIARILSRHGLAGVEVRANHLDLTPAPSPGAVTFVPSFPYTDEECDRCACCKRNQMLTASADEDIIVYIGEGYSDRCPAGYADLVFAKDDLLRWCRENSVGCYEYTSFRDVSTRIGKMISTADTAADGRERGLPRRRRAAIARRDLYLGG